jgi:predicted nuclease of predicted toxin-antitoxin system
VDENLSPKIAEQLQRRGIDAISVRDLSLLGDSDENHLERATGMGRVPVTTDVDFLRLAATGKPHAGIIFGNQQDHTLGEWVKNLELLCFIYTSQDMVSHIEYF